MRKIEKREKKRHTGKTAIVTKGQKDKETAKTAIATNRQANSDGRQIENQEGEGHYY